MKKVFGIVRRYKLFSLAVLAIIVGLGLLFAGFKKEANIIIAIVAIFELLFLLSKMWNELKMGRYGIDILAATAIVASVALGQYWAAIVIVLMFTGGEALEKYAEARAKTELKTLLSNAPQKAQILKKGKLIDVKVNEIHVGDKVFLKAGDLVPVDCVITDGAANFDESSLTGESIPQARQVDDLILSGSINLDGAVTAKATKLAEDSQYQQIIKLVRGASATQAPFVRLADRYSIPFTILAFAISLGAWAYTGEAIRFLEVIVVATPCPLILAAPIALISGMSRASRYGIIVKNGSALERLATSRTMAFDKTGTLTNGELSVDSVNSFGSFTQESILGAAASLEQSSSHVLAPALVEAAKAQGIKLKKAKHVKEIAGQGLQATIKRQSTLVGRYSLLESHGINMPDKFNPKDIDKTVIYVAIGDELAGYITLRDELRDETAVTLNRLRDMGVGRFMMVTGDNQAVADTVAKQLGIGRVHAETLPAEKLHILDEVKDRPIAFVGDGVNDAPILTAADVGIALGAKGSSAASEAADVVIMLNDFGRVAIAVAVAKRTFFIAKQSILIGIGLSVALMLIFASGRFTALAGAIVQEIVDVLVILNALRAHNSRIKV